MKTRFTPLVKMKQNILNKCERDLSQANEDKKNAKSALDAAYLQLQETRSLTQGTVNQMLQERAILEIQRNVIDEKRAWLNFASNQVVAFQKKYKELSVEYEKYRYLEAQEIKTIVKKRTKLETKELDESALLSFMHNKQEGV
ncbi:MAG: flagellar FliJ family protein [Campylobacterota bacterium]|nr:flagellar FliJ family protein [Campylobacterota bacterium]